MAVGRQAVDCANHSRVECPLHILSKGVLALADAPEDVDFLRGQSLLNAESLKIDFELSQLTASRHVGGSAAPCSVEPGRLTVVGQLSCERAERIIHRAERCDATPAISEQGATGANRSFQ